MPAQSNFSRGQFASLKMSTTNAIGIAFTKETEALDAGNEDLADQLFAERMRLSMELSAIREAEIAYLNSAKGAAAAEKILKQQAEAARKTVKNMKNVTKVLDGLSKLVGILTKLAGLF